MKLADGIIELHTKRAMELGFTADKFQGYLWKDGDTIMVSFIFSKYPRCGNFRKLVHRIHELGFTVKVPTPLGLMQEIVLKNGYKLVRETDEATGEAVDVWVLPPPTKEKKS